jgi:hypothetical protein
MLPLAEPRTGALPATGGAALPAVDQGAIGGALPEPTAGGTTSQELLRKSRLGGFGRPEEVRGARAEVAATQQAAQEAEALAGQRAFELQKAAAPAEARAAGQLAVEQAKGETALSLEQARQTGAEALADAGHTRAQEMAKLESELATGQLTEEAKLQRETRRKELKQEFDNELKILNREVDIAEANRIPEAMAEAQKQKAKLLEGWVKGLAERGETMEKGRIGDVAEEIGAALEEKRGEISLSEANEARAAIKKFRSEGKEQSARELQVTLKAAGWL